VRIVLISGGEKKKNEASATFFQVADDSGCQPGGLLCKHPTCPTCTLGRQLVFG